MARPYLIAEKGVNFYDTAEVSTKNHRLFTYSSLASGGRTYEIY